MSCILCFISSTSAWYSLFSPPCCVKCRRSTALCWVCENATFCTSQRKGVRVWALAITLKNVHPWPLYRKERGTAEVLMLCSNSRYLPLSGVQLQWTLILPSSTRRKGLCHHICKMDSWNVEQENSHPKSKMCDGIGSLSQASKMSSHNYCLT